MIDALMPLVAMYALIVIAILMWPEMRAPGVIIREIWRTWLLRNWRLIATGDYLAWAIDARRTGPLFCEWCNGHIDDDGDCACVDEIRWQGFSDLRSRAERIETIRRFADGKLGTVIDIGTPVSQALLDAAMRNIEAPRDSLPSIVRDLQDLSDTAHLELRDRARLAAIIFRLEQLP